ncbi:MAG: hypothetical protein P4M15_00300 [Alphaproteobacteria bacterium]|nr:hypothetical protein [Alphaproteobacteria bacterium]
MSDKASTWRDLADRCAKATGADRELDSAIACAAFGWTRETVEIMGIPDVAVLVDTDGNGPQIEGEYTGSLDCIVSLIERELPGQSWNVGWSNPEILGLDIPGFANCGDDDYGTSEAATPTLALCAAFCTAMAAKSEAE